MSVVSRHAPTVGLLVVCVGTLAAILTREAPRQPPAPSKPPVIVDSAKNCETIRAMYLAALSKAQSCSSDEECTVDVREGAFAAINGCGRYRTKSADLSQVDTLEKAWLGRGCANKFLLCVPSKPACIENRCAELPPEPVPRNWQRITHTTALNMTPFTFFIPPELTRVDVRGEDSDVGLYEARHYELHWEYGEYSPSFEDIAILKKEERTIAGAKALLILGRLSDRTFVSTVSFEQTPSNKRLSIWTSCKRAEDCRALPTVAQSVQFP